MEVDLSKTRLWECPSSSGGKFWSCSVDGSLVTTSWGRLNTKGQTKTTDHVTEEKAKKFVETTIKKKEKEGYKEKVAKKESPKEEKVKKETIKKIAKKEVVKDDENVKDEGPLQSYVLPTLYNTDSKGKERIWKVWVVKNKVTKKHGEVGGKQTIASRSYEGKNTGRSNETDAEEQAKREAERDWVKQTDKGYKPKTKEGKALYQKVQNEKVKQGGVNTNIANVLALELRDVKIESKAPQTKALIAKKIEREKKKAENGALPDYQCDLFPMGCQKWINNPENSKPEDKVLKYFDFKKGVYIQRKLDGIRCVVRIVKKDGKKHVVMTSRQGNQFVHLKKLRSDVLKFLKGSEDVVLDCEVYADEIYATVTYKGVDSTGKSKIVFGVGGDDDLSQPIPKTMNFKAITSTVRSTMTTPGPLEDQMCLYVFDIVDPTETLNQDERFEILEELFNRKPNQVDSIKRVETILIHKLSDVKKYHDVFAKEGYEGVVLRSRELKYECLKKNKKSKWMRKYKYFLDSEFEIIGAKCDKGVDREQFTWICKSENGLKFYPKPEGTREMKWEWYDNRDDYVGKILTVRYQGLEESGIPRFPIGVEIRDYE